MLGSLDPEATIAAIASPPGAGLRGIVRLSGPQAWAIALAALEPDARGTPPGRSRFYRGRISLEELYTPLPASVCLWRSPRSYTGEDVSEIHTLGSPPLLGLVLAGCLARGARHALPGEFTLRAFLRGRLDLTRAEAVLGVIHARSPAQLDVALDQLAGGLSRPMLALRERLLNHVADLEANLDFAEEADVDPLARDALASELAGAAAELARLTERLTHRGRRSGYPRVVLTGPPNAGKSRLFNALAGADQAIVSSRSGTTRDYLTARCTCDGLTVELVDTAGIETAGGSIQVQAQSLREEQVRQADLVLLCTPLEPGSSVGAWTLSSGPILRVGTKLDLAPDRSAASEGLILAGAATGEGLDVLQSAIARCLQESDREGDLPASTAARCRDSLVRAGQALGRAGGLLCQGGSEELVAIELRLAVDELGKVVGAVFTDDILDRIFQKFCIGK